MFLWQFSKEKPPRSSRAGFSISGQTDWGLDGQGSVRGVPVRGVGDVERPPWTPDCGTRLLSLSPLPCCRGWPPPFASSFAFTFPSGPRQPGERVTALHAAFRDLCSGRDTALWRLLCASPFQAERPAVLPQLSVSHQVPLPLWNCRMLIGSLQCSCRSPVSIGHGCLSSVTCTCGCLCLLPSNSR